MQEVKGCPVSEPHMATIINPTGIYKRAASMGRQIDVFLPRDRIRIRFGDSDPLKQGS